MFLNIDDALSWKRIAVASEVAAELCAAGVLWLDAPVYFYLRRFDGAWARVVDVAFSFKAWVLATAAALAVAAAIKNLWRGKRSPEAGMGIKSIFRALRSVLCALLLSGAAVWVLKVSFGRMRPAFLEFLDKTGFYPFTSGWAFNSMPSGHAAASFAGLVMLGLLYPRLKPAAWMLAVVIGISRVCSGAHFPSDVLLGAIIGMVSADFCFANCRPRHVKSNSP
jgi:membrane-associated phospholipid phosphatase